MGLLALLHAAGLEARVVRERLVLRPGEKLTPHLTALVKEHAARLKAWLLAQADPTRPPPFVCHLCGSDDWHLDPEEARWRCAFCAAANRAQLELCRAE